MSEQVKIEGHLPGGAADSSFVNVAGIVPSMVMNAQKKAKYQADLDNIEKGLAAVEAKFSDAGSAQGDGGQSRK